MPKGDYVLSFIACGRGVAKKQNSWYILRKAACHFSDALRIKHTEGNVFSKSKAVTTQRRLFISGWLDVTHLLMWGLENKP